MSNADLTTVIGASGTGKTTMLEAFLKSVTRQIVLTTKPTGFKTGYVQVTSFEELKKELLKRYHHKRVKICLRQVVGPKDIKLPPETMRKVAQLMFAMQKVAFKKDALKPIVLTVDEAQVFCPNGGDQSGIQWLVSEGREWELYRIFATQRPTNIPPLICDNSENICLLQLSGDTAINTYRSLLGSAFKNPRKFHYAFYRQGNLVSEGNTKKPEKIINLP